MKQETKEKILKEYFVKRASIAGKANLKKHGKEFYAEIGRKGGKAGLGRKKNKLMENLPE